MWQLDYAVGDRVEFRASGDNFWEGLRGTVQQVNRRFLIVRSDDDYRFDCTSEDVRRIPRRRDQ